jgi:hypothetical protein
MRPVRRTSIEWREGLEIPSQKRVRESPVGSAFAVDDARVAKRLQCAPDSPPACLPRSAGGGVGCGG